MATVLPAAEGTIDTLEGTGPSLVILIAMIVIFGAAAFFTGHGRAGMIAGFFLVVTGLYTLGGIHFG
jgi:hypothetical protein